MRGWLSSTRHPRGIRWALTAGVAVVGAGVAAAPATAAVERVVATAHVQARLLPPGAPATTAPTQPRAIPLLVRNPAALAGAKRAASGQAGPAPSRSAGASPSTPAAPTQTAVFGTLNAAGASAAQQISDFGQGNDTTPPDTTGAIGPSDYVEMVNAEIVVYDRADLTQIGSPVDVATFTGGVSPCDVQIKYDPASDRWFYVALRCDGTTSSNELYVGWSKTSDPSDLSGGWCRFSVTSTPSTSLDDYPKLGIDGSHLIIGTNTFDASSNVFQTAHILVAAKPASGSITTCPAAPSFTVFGSAASPLLTASGNLAFTPEPATVSDTTSTTGYVVAADFADSTFDQSGSGLMIWQIDGTNTAPTLVADGDLAVPDFSVPPSIPQPGTSDAIDSLDGRLTQAVAAADLGDGGAEAVWTQHTVSDGARGSLVRWYELVPATMTLVQSGTIKDRAGFAFNGAITPTMNGSAVINYNTGGPAQEVQIKAQSRVGTDPGGTMSGPVTLAASSAIDSDFSCPSQPFGSSNGTGVCRWGDYAGASVDPNNPDVAWGSNQVNGPTGTFIDRFGDQAQWETENFALTAASTPAPTASFTATPDPAVPGSPVSFDGSRSSDPTDIVDYSWSFGDGSSVDSGLSSTASHGYLSPGVYMVRLTVTHSGGQTASQTETVTVDRPAASFTAAPNPTTPGAAVAFNAGASSDAIGTITAYSWTFGDGAGGSGATPTHTFTAPGSYTVALTVTNNFGQTASSSTVVTVNAPPTASFTIIPNPADVGTPVGFDASGSTHPAGISAGYTWAFGDGGSANGPVVSHSYTSPGSYAITLTVVDSDGQSSTTIEDVTIIPRPPGKPPQLTGRLSIGRQRVAAIRQRGLVVTLSTNQGHQATFRIVASIKPAKGTHNSSTMTLLRGRTLTVAAGSHRLTLKLSKPTARALASKPVTSLTVTVVVVDAFGQKLTLSASLKL